ncbi:hypothetical protein Glove_429g16 [Diversispora epigaea]|uniref:Cep57 centrosome microtubule-binding domain-containing protein n=1 Tax=Diversispora epigaea TaxID=1348612 RepID=A0A397GV74_9GLOM|nr:hypothetical protein Glove_429g16 [Diversispora epigaea]
METELEGSLSTENFDVEGLKNSTNSYSTKFQEPDCISLEDKSSGKEIDEKSNASDLHPGGDDFRIEINIFSEEEMDEKDSRMKINNNISFSDEINEKSSEGYDFHMKINNKFKLNVDGFENITGGLDITEIKGSCRKEFCDIVGENCLFDDDDFLKSQNLLNNNIYKSLFGGTIRHRKLNSGELHRKNVQDEQHHEKEFQTKLQIHKQCEKYLREVKDHEEVQDEQFSQELDNQLLQREHNHQEEMTRREQCVEEQLHQDKDCQLQIQRHQQEFSFSEKKCPNEQNKNFFYQDQTLFQVPSKKYLESQQRNEQFPEITSSLINTHDKMNADKFVGQLEKETEQSLQLKDNCRSTQGQFDEKYDKGNVAYTNKEKLEIHVTSMQKKYEALKRQLEYSRQYILKAEEERDEAQKALTMAKQEITQMNEKYEYFNGTQTNPIFVSSTASSSTSLNYKSDEWIVGNTNTEKLKNVRRQKDESSSTSENDFDETKNFNNKRFHQNENQYADFRETQDNYHFTNGHDQFNSHRKFYENPNQFASSSRDKQYYNTRNNISQVNDQRFGHTRQQKKYKNIRDEIPSIDPRKSIRKQPDFSHNHFEYTDDQIADQNNSFQDKSRWMNVKNGKSHRKKLICKVPFIVGMDPGKSTVNLQQTFATSKSHNTKSCSICKKDRISENNKLSHNQEISGIDIALVRIISNVTDELTHLKMCYSNLVSEYQAIGPVGNKARRVILIKEMKEVMNSMEIKRDQIATLHNVHKKTIEPSSQKGYQTCSKHDNNVLRGTGVQEKDA